GRDRNRVFWVQGRSGDILKGTPQSPWRLYRRGPGSDQFWGSATGGRGRSGQTTGPFQREPEVFPGRLLYDGGDDRCPPGCQKSRAPGQTGDVGPGQNRGD